MTVDVTVELISATVQLEQPLGDGTRTVGTGFMVSAPTPDGKPRMVLVTAGHVFARMPGDKLTIGYRIKNPDGTWKYAPHKVPIRQDGQALWLEPAGRDVAVLTVTAPDDVAQSAIPLNWLATDDTFERYQVGPGDEMMALGFPKGLSANGAGFPIVRSGRIASYPLGPSAAFPTFLLDFQVFPGNSGGPVYLANLSTRHPGPVGGAPFIAGLLTRSVAVGGENLGIGVVVQARYIREAVAMLDAPPTPPPPREPETPANLHAVTAESAGKDP